MPESEPSTCPDCGGNGITDDKKFCTTCMGGGSLPVIGINRYLKEKLNKIERKCEEIFAKLKK